MTIEILGDVVESYAREVDDLIQEAKKQTLTEVASWFIKKKAALSITPRGHSEPFKRYYELLHAAAMCNRGDVIKFLCSLGYDVNLHDRDQTTPLGICIEQGNIELVRFLLDQGADVNKGSHYGFPLLTGGSLSQSTAPLNIAIAENNLEMALLLRSRGGYISEYVGKTSWLDDFKSLMDGKYKSKDDRPTKLILMDVCLESKYNDLTTLKPEDIKKS